MEMTEEHRVFLNDLRESGVTNMFGAESYLEESSRKKTAKNHLMIHRKRNKTICSGVNEMMFSA